jgi:peptidoglycan/xylan/chitin deacetylase (PgdA/CDA1 family)
MRLYSLLYHDVVDPAVPDASGFPGGAAARYKLRWSEFEDHLDALSVATERGPLRIDELDTHVGRASWLMTFDDGGASARPVGERLARLGWAAHFFITVDRLGDPTFVSADDVRALAALGHVIGSHSYSHPDHMATAPYSEVLEEWTRSTEALGQIVGEPVRVASVPAGSYAPHVAKAAAEAGITALFTSEPEAQPREEDECLVLGRYTLRRSSRAQTAARIAAGARRPRARQFLAWRAKRGVRRVIGPSYEGVRRRLMG